MDAWLILGISKTKDESIIRNAYKEQLKYNHPEDNPEGFKALRAAYDEALTYARKPDDETEGETFDDTVVGHWLQSLSELYANYPRRIRVENWRALFEEEAMYCLDTRQEAQEKMLAYLMDHHLLPHIVWKFVMESLELRENRNDWKEMFPEDFLDYVINNGTYQDNFAYDMFEQWDASYPYEDYIQCYFRLRTALGNHQAEEAESVLHTMESMPLTHPYTRISQVHYYILVDRKEEADALSEELYGQYPDNNSCKMCRAQFLSNTERYEEARPLFEAVAEEDEDDLSARCGVADCLMGTGDYKAAQKIYKELLMIRHYDGYIHYCLTRCNDQLIPIYTKEHEENPEDSEAAINLCWCYYQNNCMKEAYEVIKDYHADDIYELDFSYLKGRSLCAMRRFQESEEHFRRWLELYPTYKDAEGEIGKRNREREELVDYFLAEIYMERKEYEEALKLSDHALSVMKTDADLVLAQRGRILLKLERPDEALEVLTDALDAGVDNVQAMVIMGDAYEQMGRLSDAVRYYERAFYTLPYLPEAYAKLMRLYLDENLVEQAEELLKNFKEGEVQSDAVSYMEGALLERKQSYEEALAMWEQVIAHMDEEDTESDLTLLVDKDVILARRARLALHLHKISPEEAIQAMEQVVAMNPKHVGHRYDLGNMLAEHDRLDDALAAYEEALKLRPDSDVILMAMADIHSQRRDEREREVLEKIISLYPEHEEAYGHLGDYYDNRREYDQALKYFGKQLEIRPLSYYYVARGLVYMERFDAQRALADFEDAIRMDENNPYAYYNKARQLLRMRRTQEAAPLLEKAVECAKRYPKAIFFRLLINTYCRLHRFDDAVAVAEELKKALPDNLIGWYDQACVYRAKGDLKNAIDTLMDGYQRDKKDVYTFREEVIEAVLGLTHDEKQTMEFVKKRRKEAKLGQEFYVKSADVYRTFGNDEEVYKALTQVEKPSEADLINLYDSCKKLEKKDKLGIKSRKYHETAAEAIAKAREMAEKGLHKADSQMHALYYMTLIELRLGHLQKAKEALQRMETATICDFCRCAECYEYHAAKAEVLLAMGDELSALTEVDLAENLRVDDADLWILRREVENKLK